MYIYPSLKIGIGFLKYKYNDIVWRVIFGGANFRGKLEKDLRINFCGFKFRDSNPNPRA